jgi:hypothetical protein
MLLLTALAGCAATGPAAASLPTDFPTAIPLASSSITDADALGSSWTAKVSVDGAKGQAAALEKLRDKGFAVIGASGATASDRTYSLANANYSVRLGFEKSEHGYFVSYTVSERAVTK